jgi:hypothetical protein
MLYRVVLRRMLNAMQIQQPDAQEKLAGVQASRCKLDDCTHQDHQDFIPDVALLGERAIGMPLRTMRCRCRAAASRMVYRVFNIAISYIALHTALLI